MKCFILPAFLLFSWSVGAQTAPCTDPAYAQFDFWVGEWTLTWNDTLHGTNRVEKILGNCTVQENFSDPKTGFRGQSWSVYNRITGQWKQTWVDNSGAYIVLSGGMQGDSMVLTTPEFENASGKQVSRMVFYNIGRNALDWNWELSKDAGKTWTLLWKIHYERKK